MLKFYFHKLRADENTTAELLPLVLADPPGKQYWGVFRGLFGLAANELIVVSTDGFAAALQPWTIQQENWQPTVRPLDVQPCSQPGLYVFRRFHVRRQDVDEVVHLSTQAWRTFAGATDYAAEPMGLFQPDADEEGIVKLQLVTWYDGFASWQHSRKPHPQAAENFRRRQQLTLTTYAIATQLVN